MEGRASARRKDLRKIDSLIEDLQLLVPQKGQR
jgi:hypothetical protein